MMVQSEFDMNGCSHTYLTTISVCCGAAENWEVEEMCSECKEWTGFEEVCVECGETVG